MVRFFKAGQWENTNVFWSIYFKCYLISLYIIFHSVIIYSQLAYTLIKFFFFLMILEITLRCLCPLIRREVARMYLNSKSSTNEKTDALQKFDLPSYPRN